MSAFVLLSLTIAITIVAVTVVVGVRLARTATAMTRSAQASLGRITPLTQELQDEVAVTQTELEHLQERTRRLRDGRGG